MIVWPIDWLYSKSYIQRTLYTLGSRLHSRAVSETASPIVTTNKIFSSWNADLHILVPRAFHGSSTGEAWQCLVVVMVLVMAAELPTMAAIVATTLKQLETEKTHSSSAAGWPQRHGRALLAFSAPPCTLPPRTEYNLWRSCATSTPAPHTTLSLCATEYGHRVVCVHLTFSWLEIWVSRYTSTVEQRNEIAEYVSENRKISFLKPKI